MSKTKSTRKNIFWLTTPTFLVLVIAGTLFWFFDRMKIADQQRNQTIIALSAAQTLLAAITDAETNTRGYIITSGDESLLRPEAEEQQLINNSLRELREKTTSPEAMTHVDKLGPLIQKKLERLHFAITTLRENDKDLVRTMKLLGKGPGKQIMDQIREEISSYNRLQNARLQKFDADYHTNLNLLFAFLICASIFMLLFAQAFAYGIYRNIHQRLMDLVHQETKRSLDTQEALNQQLNLAYITVQDSERKLEVTLNSIADAVIATDKEARVTLMNRVAELLTGWTQEEALGCPIADIFRMVSKSTGQPMTVPVMQTLLHGAAQGSNDTILIMRDGNRLNIANSCAPIRDHDGQVIGAVLVFRDVTAENAAQQALLDSTALLQTILSTVVDAIITFDVRTNRIETVNAAAERMFGYTASELIGQRFSSIVPELIEDNGSLDYYNAAPGDRANGMIREVTGRTKDGFQFPMEISVSEMKLGGQRYFTGVLRNITARKHAEAVMRESEDRYRNLFNTIDEGFCTIEMIYDEDGKACDYRFLEVNPSFEKQSGIANATGRRINELVAGFDPIWFEIYGNVVETQEPQRFIQQVKALNRWYDVYACPEMGVKSRKVIVLFTDITERKHAEQALRESDERVRLATEATGVGIWEWNLQNNTVRWDAQMFRIYGEEPTLNGFLDYQTWASYLLPEDLRAQQEALQEAINSKQESAREFRIKRGDEIRYIRSVETIRTNAAGEVESLVGTNLDITELKRTEATLRESERHLRTVIDALPVAIYTTDAEGCLTHYNQAAVEFAGRTPALGEDRWSISQKLFNIDGAPLPAESDPMAIALREDRQILGAEAIAERPDGTRVWFTAYPTPLRDVAGRLMGGINMLIDITERKRMDQILLENNIEMKKAKYLAEKANQAKSDFLSNMSHELRTPLSAILGFAQLIDAGNPPPTASQKRSIDQILQAGWYLLDLINEILDLTLIESGKLSVSIEPVLIPELVRECRTMIEPLAQKRGITLDLPQFEGSFTVKADHTRLKQVLINLLSNAVKYNRDQGRIIVRCEQPEPGRARISVEDTGEGLPPEKLAQLFQPFNRLGKENSSEEGTGIGLVMTKRLIELMGGQINVESEVGKGTCFWIDLEMSNSNRALAGGEQIADGLPLHSQQESASKRTLLYVEDNPANLMLVEDIVATRPDIILISARDGYTGIDLARIAQPELILMDINLPGLSGTEVLRILAKDPITSHIPVVALSANAIPRDIDKGLEAGFFRYLTKPIKINEFMRTLDEALDLATRKSLRANGEKIT